MEKDPLSLFAGDSSSTDSSDCEDDNLKAKKSLKDHSYYTSTQTDNSIKRLPSPNTLFSTVKKPEFLNTHISPVNWDSLAKNIDTEQNSEDEENSRHKFAAIPPPPEHNTEVDPRAEISSEPVKYTIPDIPTNSRLLTVSSDDGDNRIAGEKRSRNIDNDTTNVTKKPKESFKEKEKRKRDLGMSSRGKSFVEEEKRILRENFDKTK